MSTYVQVITHGEIDRAISSLKLGNPKKVHSVQALTFAMILARVLAIYKGVSPLLHYIATWMIIPTRWRTALTAFIEALDLLAATPFVPPSAPIVASAAADTPTDPISTDPSFKAGKDL